MPDIVATRVIIPVRTNADTAAKSMRGLSGAIDRTSVSLKKGTRTMDASRTAIKKNKLATDGLISSLKNVKIVSAAAVIALGFVGKELIQLASDAEETRNKFNVTFGTIKDDAGDAAKVLANSFGLASQEAQKLLSNTGDLLTGFGFTQREALNLSRDVQTLAADLASFTNIEGGTERASAALTAALFGEREAAKALGIVITENDLKQRLAAKGLGKLRGQALLQAKAAETLAIAQEQSKNAIGDFARSANSAANVIRRVGSRLKDIGALLGTGLLPLVSKLGLLFLKITSNLEGPIKIIQAIFEGVGSIISEVLEITVRYIETALEPLFAELKNGAKIAKVISDVFRAFKETLAGIEPVIQFVAKVIAISLRIVLGIVKFAIKQFELFASAIEAVKRQLVAFGIVNETVVGSLDRQRERMAFVVKNSNKARRGIARLTKAYRNYRKEALEFLAASGDVSAQLQLLDQQFKAQVAIVKKAGLDATTVERFALEQRKNQINEFFVASTDIQNAGFSERQDALDSAYQSLLESDKLSNESRIAAQRAYTERSKALEQDRMAAIQQGVDLFAQTGFAAVNLGKQITRLQNAQIESQIEAMKKRGATEEEIEQKRKELERKRARDAKTLGIIQAVINTALGVTRALALPFPLNFVVAGLVAAAGAVEIAAIAATPVPAQFGGDFVVPPGNEADSGLLRVNQGEQVSVTPTRSSGQGMPEKVELIVGEQKFDAYMVKSMNRNLNNGKVQIRRRGVVKTA